MGMLAIGDSARARSTRPLADWYRRASGLKQIIVLSAVLALIGLATFGAMLVAFRDLDLLFLAPLAVLAVIGLFGLDFSPYLAFSAFSLLFSTFTIIFATPLLLFGFDGVGTIVFGVLFSGAGIGAVASARNEHGVGWFETILVQLGMVLAFNAAVWGTLFVLTR